MTTLEAVIYNMAETQYEFGLTPEETGEGILSALTKGVDYFTPLRREVITPPETTYTEADGAVYKSTTPGEYGETERGIEYMPVVQGAREAYDVAGKFFTDGKYRAKAADALMTGIGQMFSDYQDVGAQMIADPGPGATFYDAEEGREVTLDPSLPVGMGMAAGALLPVKGPGMVAGMFAGKEAKTADLGKLAQAEKMANKGHSRDEIWDQTGWFRWMRDGEPDSPWKFEISDLGAKARFNPIVQTPTGRLRPDENPVISDLLEHPELYKAYPGMVPESVAGFSEGSIKELTLKRQKIKDEFLALKNSGLSAEEYAAEAKRLNDLDGDLLRKFISAPKTPDAPAFKVESSPPYKTRAIRMERPLSGIPLVAMKSNQWGGAYYHPYLDTIGTRARPGQERQKGSPYEPSDIFRGDMIHELQHGIQERTKGWQSGSHPAEFVGSNIRDKETGKKLNKVEVYMRTAGEAEARLADFRKDFTDEQRSSNPPWTAAGGLDRPESKLIFRNNYD
tara:strand:- start:44 stop:1567 length:1524 start_codon:yes stop_codon:yes gene_type:complete